MKLKATCMHEASNVWSSCLPKCYFCSFQDGCCESSLRGAAGRSPETRLPYCRRLRICKAHECVSILSSMSNQSLVLLFAKTGFFFPESDNELLSSDHRDPDSVVLCVLATDEEDEDDIALQIHFTLLQAFCCENDINILRVSGLRRLAQVIGEPSSDDSNNNGEPRDFHCILVTVSIRASACIIYRSRTCRSYGLLTFFFFFFLCRILSASHSNAKR